MELLLRRHDKTNPDTNLDFWCLKAGDVVTVVQDGHPWTVKEKTNADWRILAVPLLSEEQALTLVQPEFHPLGEGEDKARHKQAREFRLDVGHSSFTQAFADFWHDDTRAIPVFTLDWNGQKLLNVRVKRNGRLKA